MILPTFRTAFSSIERLFLSHLLQKNEELRNRHAGQKALLFATGASLVGMDLGRFNRHVTIGCNYIFRHPSFSSMDLNYFVAGVPFRRWRQLSPRFTHEDHHRWFLSVNEAFHDRDTVHFYHATIRRYLEKRSLLANRSCYYFLRKGSLEGAKTQAVDLAEPITFADGGLLLMVALAIFMGCKEIYLFGCGYSYAPVQKFHFYDCMRYLPGLSESELNAAKSTFQLSHPETNFMNVDTTIRSLGGGELMMDYSWDPVKHGAENFYSTHRLVRSFAESIGVRIVNVVPPGYSSPVYESITEEEYCELESS